MDIPSLSMNMAQSRLMSDVSTAMLAKTMEQASAVSDTMTQLLDSAAMENSVYPNLGANIDISI